MSHAPGQRFVQTDSPPPDPLPPAAAASAGLAIGSQVRLLQRPPYLKTADPMPMLRPPDLIGVDELGVVVELRALGQLAVRFRRGTFLLAAALCAPASG